jgi:hypothetical protein
MKAAVALGIVLGLGTAGAATPPPVVAEIDGLVSTAPADWEEQPAGGMRHKQFLLKPAKADERKTELIIFFFGAGQGGSAADNLTRWKSMFEKAEPVVTEETIGGAKATIVELSGTYLSRPRPMDTSTPPERLAEHRMIGVVLETPHGPYFMRLLGPDRTVQSHKPAFLKWLRGLKKK